MSKEPTPRPCRSTKKNPGRFIDSILSAYEPDKDFAIKNRESLIPKFLKAVEKKDLVESARIMEVNRFGAYRIRQVNGTAEFRAAMAEAKKGEPLLRKLVEVGVQFRPADKFTESERVDCEKLCESSKFREDFFMSDNDTNSGRGNPFDEYTPLIGGPWSHQLYLHDFLDMLAKSFEAWNHSPYAHQIIRITTCFVLGRGVSFKAKDRDVQAAFQKWWEAEGMDGRLESWSDMLGRDGELMIRRFVNPLTKRMFIRWIDPSTIWEVVSDLEDIELQYYFHQQYPTAYQVLYGAPAGSKFDPSKFDSTKYIINQIPADEVYHLKVNVSPNEKRGRSDLFPILGWLKRYKDFQTGIVLRAIVQSVFAWKNKLKGSQTDVDAFVQQFGSDVPDFGSLWTENEASDLQPMTAGSGGNSNLNDAPGIVTTIAVGPGIPREYLGASEHGNRATAVISSEPGVKKFQSRQLLLGRLLRKIAKDWFENEVAAGRLPKYAPGDDPELSVVLRWLQKAMKRAPMLAAPIDSIVKAMSGSTLMVPTDGSIDFMFPEIAVEDRSAKIADLQSALDGKAISHERYSVAIAKELGFHDYIYADEQDKLAEEQVDMMGDLYAPGGPPPVAAGAPPPSGVPAPTPGTPQSAVPAPAPAPKPEVKPQPKPSGGLSGEDRRSVKLNDRR